MDGNVPQLPPYTQPLQAIVDLSQDTRELIRQRNEQELRLQQMLADQATRIGGTSQPK